MPDKAVHVRKATDNETLATKLDLAASSGPNWAIIMTFYSAVHYVEAYFFGQGKHYQLHQARESAIKRDSKIKGIFRNYERLKTASIYARYEADFFTDKQYGGLQPNLDAIKKVIRPLI